MRVFHYDAAACGVKDGGIRLKGGEPTDDPLAADVFVVPCNYFELGSTEAQKDARLREAFPYVEAFPTRHIVADLIEHVPPPMLPGLVYCRAALTPATLEAYPSAVAMPWWVGRGMFGDDLGQRLDAAADSFDWTHDVAFVGWRTPGGRQRQICDAVVASAKQAFQERAFLATFDDFHGHRDQDDETRRREQVFTDAMARAPLQLAPASAPGVLRYRVFEALRAGRLPVIIDDVVVLPDAERVDWDRVAIHVPTNDAWNLGEILRPHLADVATLHARCREARTAWLRCFNGAHAGQQFAEIARTQIWEKVGAR